MPRSRRQTPARLPSAQLPRPLSRPPTARSLFGEDTVATSGEPAAPPPPSPSLPAADVEAIAQRVAQILQLQNPPHPRTPLQSPERPRRHLQPDKPGLMNQPGPPPLVLPPPDPDPADALPRQWTDYLQEQRLVNANFSRRDTEELRTLLIACDRPPAVNTVDCRILRDRLKLYLVAAHRGWSAALQALPNWELAQLVVTLPAPP